MKLIADSGSTKAIWTLLDKSGQSETFTSAGINPYQQTESQITAQLSATLDTQIKNIESIHFYCSGATEQSSEKIKRSFNQINSAIQEIEIQSDIVAVAHALCKSEAGIACILGTGSNSCLYDGNTVISNIGGYGFILGDDGSGAVLGKQLMIDFLHQRMPNNIYKKLKESFKLHPDLVLERVYRAPFPNRFLAGFAPFLLENVDNGYIQSLIRAEFRLFFKRKVLCYPNYDKYIVHFVGSIAYYFEMLLRQVGKEFGIEIGHIAKDPMKGLIEYHTTLEDKKTTTNDA